MKMKRGTKQQLVVCIFLFFVVAFLTLVVASIIIPWCWLAVCVPVSAVVAIESATIVVCIVLHPTVIVVVAAIVTPGVMRTQKMKHTKEKTMSNQNYTGSGNSS